MWSRKSRRKQRAALRKPVRCVHGAGRAPRGRAGVAPGQPQSGSLIGCVAERGTCSALHWDARSASFALHVGNLCTFATVLWAVRAHTQRYACMHAVSPRVAVVTRSESVASVRFRLCSCDRSSCTVCSGVRVGACRTRVHFRAIVMFLGVLSMPKLVDDQ